MSTAVTDGGNGAENAAHAGRGEDTREMFEDEQDPNTKKLLVAFSKKSNDQMSVDRSDLERILEVSIKQREAFLKLPFTTLFFVIFCCSTLAHEQIPNSSSVQRELRGMLTGTTFEGIQYTSGHKDMGDIDTKEDVWTYILEVIIPLFINDLSVGPANRHRVLRYNHLIGGVELQQVRRKKVICGDEYPDLGPFPRSGRANPILENFGCYPWYTESDDCFGPWNSSDTSRRLMGFCPDSKRDLENGFGFSRGLNPFADRRLDFVPDSSGTGSETKGARTTPGPDQRFSVYFHEHEGLEASMEKARQLQKHGWIDFNTAWVGMRMLVLNPDLAMFVHISAMVYFPPSGSLLPHIAAQSFQPEPYQYMSIIGLDISFVILLIWHTFNILMKIHRAVKQGEVRLYVFTSWNWLDVAVSFGGILIVILWLILLDMLVVVKRSAINARAAAPDVGFTSDTYPVLVSEMHSGMSEVSSYLMTFRLILCWYTLLISMKFLESFSAQPRLAVVTDTIYRSGSDLIHFLIVFMIIFMSYVVSGMFLFGRRLWGFSTMQYATTTCFRMALGDFEWEALAEEHPVTAALWFWSFMVVMMLLMLNMLMAIIMDKYTEVKADAAAVDSLFQQIFSMAGEKFNGVVGRSVPLRELHKAVASMTCADVTELDLVEALPNLSKEQASELIRVTQKRVENELDKGVTMSEAMRMIGWVKLAVQKIGSKLEEILEAEHEERAMLTGNTERHADGMDVPDSIDLDALTASLEQLPQKDFDFDESFAAEGPFVAEGEERLDKIEGRIAKMENFMQEAFQYTTFRGKDLKNRLSVIEDLIRSQRDATMNNLERTMWDQPPRLGGDAHWDQ